MRVVLILLGAAAMGYGAYHLVTEDHNDVVGIAVFLGAVVVGHDFIAIPAIIAVGALVTRFAPPWARIPVQAALVVSLAVSAVAFPLVLGVGRIADNPSAFPQHYGRGLLVILAVIWAAAGLAAWFNRIRRSKSGVST